MHRVKVCAGLLCPSSGTVWALSVCTRWFCLTCALSPTFLHCLQPLEMLLYSCTLCMRCDRLSAVCHSCASCCAATPPAGQTQAPTSQTNQNNYETLQSKFPGRKRKSIWGNSHQRVWPDEEAKVASRKSAQMCLPPPSVEILKLRDISVRNSQLEPLFYLTELRAELTDSIQPSGMSYKHA